MRLLQKSEAKTCVSRKLWRRFYLCHW